jgi:hypothetical protein
MCLSLNTGTNLFKAHFTYAEAILINIGQDFTLCKSNVINLKNTI